MPPASASKPSIVFVEDEAEVVALVREALAPLDAVLHHAGDLAQGWRLLESQRPDLAILDWALPDGSGLDLCRRLRAHPALYRLPVIVLTGKGRKEEKEEGFDAGADHYLVKPFQIDEIQLWARALLRRTGVPERGQGLLRAEGLALDPEAHAVTAGAEVVRNLTRKEFELLYYLVKNRPRVLTRERILAALWDEAVRDNTVEVNITRLRAKLGAAGRRIVTVAGLGYRFE